MVRFALLLVLIAAGAPAVLAQGSKGVVAVSAAGPDAPVPAGSSFQVSVTLQVKSGYHINANKPSESYLIGTKLTLSPPSGLRVVKVAYPNAEMATFGFSETPLAVYDGTVKVVATLAAADTMAPGQVTVSGKMTFQACNDQACLPPSTVDVSATAEIVAGEARRATLTLTGAPPAARVSVDGRSVGKTDPNGRLVARDLEPGRRRVRVELDGFAPWEQQVSIDGARPQIVNVAMQPGTAATSAQQEVPPSAAPAPTPAELPRSQEAPGALDPPSGSGGSSLPYIAGFGVVVLAGLAGLLLLRR